jgi:hypothetical protein
MNKTNFNQAGGFPLKTERLQELQTAYEIFNHLGNVAGNLSILSGCAVTGSSVADGVVVINNEVISFKGGYVAANVIIIEEPSSKEFENGTTKNVYTIRYATFGTAATSWPWASFKKPIETKAIPTDLVSRLEALERKNAVFQSGGGMVLWNKPANEIPAGWAEVVNWRGRMPVGFNPAEFEFNTMGKMAGDKTKRLYESEMPSHTHGYYDIYYSEAGGTVPISGKYGSNRSDNDNAGWQMARTTDSAGYGVAFSIMNPYRVVMFIEYVG